MEYTIEAMHEKNYIRAIYKGEFESSEWDLARQEVDKLVLEHGITNILVDASGLVRNPTILNLFSTLKALPDRGGRKRRNAIIIRPDQEKIAIFLENISINRGFTLKYFFTREEALAWLLA